MSLRTSWADLAEDPPATEESFHVTGEPNFSGFLNPSPSSAGPPPALACVVGQQEEDKFNNEPLASSAKYDLRVYIPYTSNMFYGVAVEAAPPVLALKGPAVASASVTPPTSAGGSASPTVELSLLNPNAQNSILVGWPLLF